VCVPARQHQRLPLLRRCIVRLCVAVCVPIACPVPNLSLVVHGCLVLRETKVANFLAPTQDSPFFAPKPSLEHPGATLKIWKQTNTYTNAYIKTDTQTEYRHTTGKYGNPAPMPHCRLSLSREAADLCYKLSSRSNNHATKHRLHALLHSQRFCA